MAVLAPIPNASVTMATVEYPTLLRRTRIACRRSWPTTPRVAFIGAALPNTYPPHPALISSRVCARGTGKLTCQQRHPHQRTLQIRAGPEGSEGSLPPSCRTDVVSGIASYKGCQFLRKFRQAAEHERLRSKGGLAGRAKEHGGAL